MSDNVNENHSHWGRIFFTVCIYSSFIFLNIKISKIKKFINISKSKFKILKDREQKGVLF